MIKIDAHIHTSPNSGCSQMSPEDAVKAAVNAALDGIIITEHDYLWSEEALDALRRQTNSGFKVFTGVEVSCAEGHFLVFGLKTMSGIAFNMPARDLISIAHKENAAVVVAHPYRFNYSDGEYCYSLDIDGIEVMSSNTTQSCSEYAERLAERKKLPKIKSSDAHSVSVLGKFYTEYPDTIKTVRDFADYILAARGTCCS